MASAGPARVQRSPAYSRLEQLIERDQCVILDGGIATELGELEIPGYEQRDEALWGTWALLNAPRSVTRVHRGYAELGCNVISTNTWGIQEAMNGERGPAGSPPADWMELARRGDQARPPGHRRGWAARTTARWPSASTATWPASRGSSGSSCSPAPSRTSRPTCCCSRRCR